jgi:non-homologous end joining protein Ku
VEHDEQPTEGKVLDLMAALERSVEAAKGRTSANKASAKSSPGKKRTSKARKSA